MKGLLKRACCWLQWRNEPSRPRYYSVEAMMYGEKWEQETIDQVMEIISLTDGGEGFEAHYPKELSGRANQMSRDV